MQFNLYATFRLLSETKTLTIDLPAGTTVRQAVHAFVEQRPVIRPHWLDESGDIHAHVHIFINGHDVQNLEQGLDTPLQPDDILDFFPPVGGGSSNSPVIVLAMHGAPPNDFPRAELMEFMGLHARLEHVPESQRGPLHERYTLLDKKIREWPRKEENDPFFAGAASLAAALEDAAGVRVILGFNEFCAPSLEEALDQAAETGAARVVVLTPMMTRGGEHSEHEIPEAVQEAASRHPDIEFRYAWPLDLQAIAKFLSGQAQRFMD